MRSFIIILTFSSLLNSCKGKLLPNQSASKSTESLSVERPAPIPRVETLDGNEAPEYTIGEEATIATDITGAYLNLPKGMKDLGSATSVRTATLQSAEVWHKVRLFLPSRGNEEPNLVVLYRSNKAGVDVYGLIPKSQLVFETGGVGVRLEGPGIYQVAVTPLLVEKALEVPVAGTVAWKFQDSVRLTGLGRPYDLAVMNGDLFVASDQQIEYFKSGSLTSKRLASDASLRRLALGNGRPYLATQARGLGFFSGFAGANAEYQGSFLTATTAAGGAFEIGTSPGQDKILVLLQEATTMGDVAQLGFFSIAFENPSLIGSYVMKRAGSENLSFSGSNLATGLGGLIVKTTRIYALAADGLHSLSRSEGAGIASDTVLSALTQPFCMTPGALDTLIFVCHKGSRVLAVQTTDPGKPILGAEVDVGETPAQVASDTGLLFVLTASGKLHTFDSADPLKLVKRGDPLDLGLANGLPVSMKVLNGKLYIGYEGNTIMVHSY